MTAPWRTAPAWAQWCSIDAYEVMRWHEREPTRTGDSWAGGGRTQRAGDVYLLGLDWRRAIQRRPQK